MATSGSYTFNPALGELTIYAYQLIGIRPTEILQEHIDASRMATNLMFTRWSNIGVNLWQVTSTTQALTQGTSTYSVSPNTVVILDAYITVTSGSVNTDRIILPISRTEYASYPNKAQQGFPTTYWFDRLLSPTITLWPVPNVDSGPSTLTYYSVTQIQDANFQGGQTVDVPYLWLEAFADGLAYRLAKVWNPAVAPALKAVADETYGIASRQNIETAEQFISPQVFGYYRP